MENTVTFDYKDGIFTEILFISKKGDHYHADLLAKIAELLPISECNEKEKEQIRRYLSQYFTKYSERQTEEHLQHVITALSTQQRENAL